MKMQGVTAIKSQDSIIKNKKQEASVLSKPGGAPLIGKRSNVRSLYKFYPEAEKKTPEKKGVTITEPLELVLKRPKVTIKPLKTTGSEKEKLGQVEKEFEKKKVADKPVTGPKKPEVVATIPVKEAQVLEATRITGLDQPIREKGKGLEVEKPIELSTIEAVVQTAQVTSVGETGSAAKEQTAAAGGASTGFAVGQAGAEKEGAMPHSPIGPMDTLGDVYYKSYTEESRGDALHQPP
ncbi:hypothetical protein Hanom_Chr01g00093661 [Helianthus anomalus]